MTDREIGHPRLAIGVLVAGVLAIATAVVVAWRTDEARAQQATQQGPPPARVSVVTAGRQMMAPNVLVPGTVVSRNDSRIAAEIAGRVVWIADEGGEVEQGETVARIDDATLQLQRRENEAQIKRLQARLTYEQQEVARLEELADTNYTPLSRFQEAIANRDMIEQELTQARVALERTRVDIARTRVRAPFPGRVVARLTQIGEYSSPGAQIVRLVDTRHVEVRAQVPVGLAPYVEDGRPVAVSGGARAIESPIRSIIPVGDEVTRTMEIRVSLPAGLWVIGSPVQVAIPSDAPHEVTAVPRDALILRADNTYVFKIDADNKARRVVVRTGAAAGDMIEVIGDVADGDRVVVRGGERLRPDQAVDVAGTS